MTSLTDQHRPVFLPLFSISVRCIYHSRQITKSALHGPPPPPFSPFPHPLSFSSSSPPPAPPPPPRTDKIKAEKQTQEVRECVICRTCLRPKQGDGVTRRGTEAGNNKKKRASFFSFFFFFFESFIDRTACDGCRRAQVWRGSRWKHKSLRVVSVHEAQ